jgi:hypothetical protein
MVRALAERSRALVAQRSGHWVPEESPAFVGAALTELLAK